VRVSAHVLAVNASGTIVRGLRSLLGVVDEVVLVDSGSTDGTPEVVEFFCMREGLAYDCVRLSPMKFPDLFLLDVPSTWSRPVLGPFTGLSILRRFDLARNLGLDRCTGDVVVKLDADDEVLDPGGLAKVCAFLATSPRVGAVKCLYEVVHEAGHRGGIRACELAGDGKWVEKVLYDRAWRNTPESRFRQAIHEYLWFGDGLQEGLTNLGTVRDHRDAVGACRVPNRNYKVFLAEYERRVGAGEELDPVFLGSTLGEVEAVDPELARECRAISRGT
jgi:glycosyltransferase involved in cell wall biosynthesis